MRTIKTASLIQELIDRITDQLDNPEPEFDDVLSFLTKDEMDWFMGELIENLDRRNLRYKKFSETEDEEI